MSTGRRSTAPTCEHEAADGREADPDSDSFPHGSASWQSAAHRSTSAASSCIRASLRWQSATHQLDPRPLAPGSGLGPPRSDRLSHRSSSASCLPSQRGQAATRSCFAVGASGAETWESRSIRKLEPDQVRHLLDVMRTSAAGPCALSARTAPPASRRRCLRMTPVSGRGAGRSTTAARASVLQCSSRASTRVPI